MKITKTLDVTQYSDEALANFDKLASLDPAKVALLVRGSEALDRAIKERDEMKDVMRRAISRLKTMDYSNPFPLRTPEELAQALEQVLADRGIKLNE